METTDQTAATAAESTTTTAAPAADNTTETAAATPAAESTTETAADTTAAADYTDFNLPDGTVHDPLLQGEFVKTAKEAGLTQAQAQKLVDLGVTLQTKALAEHAARIEATKQAWEQQARSDKEYGGEKFDANLKIAAQAVNAFATPELKGLLDSTGLGNHPDMIRAFYKAGLMLQEDKPVAAGSAGSTGTMDAKALYPNSKLN
jgi:hypothetical protein